MRRLKSFCCTGLALAIVLDCGPASAQETDTLTMSGTFGMDVLSGTVGNDLAQAYADDFDHTWTLTLYGISYSHDYLYDDAYDESGYLIFFEEQSITRVHAASFEFRFFGPDADILNQALGNQLAGGGLTDGAFLELSNYTLFDAYDEYSGYALGFWTIELAPADPDNGVSFSTLGWTYPLFSEDAGGYPVVAPQHLQSDHSRIRDRRPGNNGSLLSYNNVMDIGPSVRPPELRIADASVREGNSGTTWLELTVWLSRFPDDVVTVNYQTADGTARKKSDYTATSGTLLFWPDEVSHVISIAIKTDRKRERDETITVRLSNAVGATIDDGVATATILNDD